MRRFPLILVLLAAVGAPATAQQVEVQSVTLPNGLEFLLLPRTEQPNSIVAGWVAKVGSANEHPGITGISHFFEHMMFKGTTTIGTRDPQRDAEFIARQKAVKDDLNDLIWTVQYRRWRQGEIDDPWDPAHDTDQMRRLRAELKSLTKEHREVIVKDEFDQVYTKLGGSGMNAFTTHDLTFYFITIPSNKFELWAWMESDRLSDSVFREFHTERDVVHEERRLRTESTPTGEFDEQFDALFWQSSPYAWPVVGWPSDLNSYTRPAAERYWNIYYRPNNLVGVVVGDFDPAEVEPVIREYFGRLLKGDREPPPVVTLEVPQKAEQRMYAECDCQPQVEVRYHTVPFSHADGFALEVLAQLLNRRTGRLYKAMVEGKRIASSATAGQDSRKYAGAFSFRAEVKGDAAPEQLEQAWYEQIARLRDTPVGDRELQKVKNQIAANAYRRLQSNFFLLLQLGFYEALGGWEYLNESPARLQAVTAADIQRVAGTYFDKTNRSVAIYTRKTGTAQDVELAGLPPQARAAMQQFAKRLKGETNVDRLQMMLSRFKQGATSMLSPERQATIQYRKKKVRQRLAELEAAEPSEAP